MLIEVGTGGHECLGSPILRVEKLVLGPAVSPQKRKANRPALELVWPVLTLVVELECDGGINTNAEVVVHDVQRHGVALSLYVSVSCV